MPSPQTSQDKTSQDKTSRNSTSQDHAPRNDTPFTTRPLGRTGSRLFIIASLLLILGGGTGIAWYVVNVAREAESATSPDTTEQVAPADTTQEFSPNGRQ